MSLWRTGSCRLSGRWDSLWRWESSLSETLLGFCCPKEWTQILQETCQSKNWWGKPFDSCTTAQSSFILPAWISWCYLQYWMSSTWMQRQLLQHNTVWIDFVSETQQLLQSHRLRSTRSDFISQGCKLFQAVYSLCFSFCLLIVALLSSPGASLSGRTQDLGRPVGKQQDQ